MTVLSLREAQERRDLDQRIVHIEQMLEAILEATRDRGNLSSIEPYVPTRVLADHLSVSVRWLEPHLRQLRERGLGHRFIAGRFQYRLSVVEGFLRSIGELTE